MTTLNTLIGQIEEIEKSGDFELLNELNKKISAIMGKVELKIKREEQKKVKKQKQQDIQDKSDNGFLLATSLGVDKEVSFTFKRKETKGVIKKISPSSVLIEFEGISRQIQYQRIITSGIDTKE